MGNKHKRCSILLLGLVLLLASSVVACGECYTQKELDAACEAAYTEGESIKEEAVKESYDKGYWAGYEDAQGEGYDRGYANGYQKGYSDGYTKGCEDCRSPPHCYVGSIKSDVYHYPWCRYVTQIYPENKIWFSSSSDARAHGYRPCKFCNPP